MGNRASRLALCWSCVVCALALQIVIQSAPAAAEEDGASAGQNDVVWHWQAQCAEPRSITVEVKLRGRLEYRQAVNICRVKRNATVPGTSQALLKFNLRGNGGSLFGEPPSTELRANIWEASADHDFLVLGVSFADEKHVWCNTLHVINPEVETQSTLARGLVIRTSPEKIATP